MKDQHYKFYGIEGIALKKSELLLKTKVQKSHMKTTTEARQVCTQEPSRFYMKQPSQRTSSYDTHITKEARHYSEGPSQVPKAKQGQV